MFYIFGLGNFGKKYIENPHNIGKIYTSFFLNENNELFSKSRNENNKYKIYKGFLKEKKTFVIVPKDIFMNNSGDCILKIEKDNMENLIVIHDDIDLKIGEFRISFAKGDGGHNGVKDIIKKAKTKNFLRIRIGVCPTDFFGRKKKPKTRDAINAYLVNTKISKKKSIMFEKELFPKISKAVEEILENGYYFAMNKFN